MAYTRNLAGKEDVVVTTEQQTRGGQTVMIHPLDTTVITHGGGTLKAHLDGLNLNGVTEISYVTTLPISGVINLLYVNTTDNKLYRWNGTAFVEVSAGTGGGGTPSNLPIIIGDATGIASYSGSSNYLYHIYEGVVSFYRLAYLTAYPDYPNFNEAIGISFHTVSNEYKTNNPANNTATYWELHYTGQVEAKLFGLSYINFANSNDYAIQRIVDYCKYKLHSLGSIIINIEAATYSVGNQTRNANYKAGDGSNRQYSYAPSPLFHFDNTEDTTKTWNITINGNGSTFKYADGLHHGLFDPTTGNRVSKPLPPNLHPTTPQPNPENLEYFMFSNGDTGSYVYPNSNVAGSYNQVAVGGDFFRFKHCGSITLSDITLDGNNTNAVVGGKSGDYDWQCDHVGLIMLNCKSVTCTNVEANNFCLDGWVVSNRGTRDDTEPYLVQMRGCSARGNARQGMSYVGGNHGSFDSCIFGSTGMNPNATITQANEPLVNPSQIGKFICNPGCGIDIEAEDSINRNITFSNCIFEECGSASVISATGDSSDMSFDNCKINGTIVLIKPRALFRKCTIRGYVVNPYISPRGNLIFDECYFTDRRFMTNDYTSLASFPSASNLGNPSEYYKDLNNAKIYLSNGSSWIEQVGINPFVEYIPDYGEGLFASEIGTYIPGHTYKLDGCVLELGWFRAGVLRHMDIKDTTFIFRYENARLIDLNDSPHLAIFDGSSLHNIRIVNDFKNITIPAILTNRLYIEISGVKEVIGRCEIIKEFQSRTDEENSRTTTDLISWRYRVPLNEGIVNILPNMQSSVDPIAMDRLRVVKSYGGMNQELGYCNMLFGNNPIIDNVAGTQGDICFNESPATDEPFAWSCTVTGTSGNAVWSPVSMGDLSIPHVLNIVKTYPGGTNYNIRIFPHSNPIGDNIWGNIGDFLINEQPAVGETMGWICTVTGGSGAFSNQSGNATWSPLALI